MKPLNYFSSILRFFFTCNFCSFVRLSHRSGFFSFSILFKFLFNSTPVSSILSKKGIFTSKTCLPGSVSTAWHQGSTYYILVRKWNLFPLLPKMIFSPSCDTSFLFNPIVSFFSFVLPIYFLFYLSPFFLFISHFFLFLWHFPLLSLLLFIFFPPKWHQLIFPPRGGGVFSSI